MSFGSKPKQPEFSPFTFRLPTGDQVRQVYEDGRLIIEPVLSAFNRRQLLQNQRNIARLSQELGRSSTAENRQVASYRNQFLQQMRQAIDSSADLSRSQTLSDLSNRFGGRYSATFGNDLLSRLEKNRQSALSEASANALLLGEQLRNEADQNRIRRIQLLQGLNSGLQQPLQSSLSALMPNSQVMQQVLSRQQVPKRKGLLSSLFNNTVGLLF